MSENGIEINLLEQVVKKITGDGKLTAQNELLQY